MDKETTGGRWIRPVTFLAVYVASLAAYFYSSPRSEVRGDFAWEQAYKLRVLGVRKAATSAAPEYISYAGSETQISAAATADVSFLVPAKTVELQGGHTHRVTVLESGAGRQVVKYEYGRAQEYAAKHLMTTHYVAYKDRVESVSGRRSQHLSDPVNAVLLAVPAYITASIARLAWLATAARRHRPPPAPPQPAKSSVLVKVLAAILGVSFLIGLIMMVVAMLAA